MPREKVVRTADKKLRRANLRRIGHLFRGYWAKLSVVTALIVLASALGVIPAFLLRAVISQAFTPTDGGKHVTVDLHLLTLLVLGMIAISLVTGAFGVVQSYLSTEVGQSVMHDLRTGVYRHLQQLSLAFFTKTRTGEVQSRIANDIGGVDNVLTSTATSVMSTITTGSPFTAQACAMPLPIVPAPTMPTVWMLIQSLLRMRNAAQHTPRRFRRSDAPHPRRRGC